VPASPRDIPVTEISELTGEKFERALSRSVRQRLVSGRFESGGDVKALQRFVGSTQVDFASALGISVTPFGTRSTIAVVLKALLVVLLRIAARHPRVICENLHSAG